MKNFKIKIILLMLVIVLLNANKCSAIDQVNKNLNLMKGYSYLLCFNDKITHYSLGNSETAKIEVISSIFNDRQEMIIKTLKETDTNLLVWTKDNIYNFNVSIIPAKIPKNLFVVSEIVNGHENTGSPIIQNFSEDNKNLPYEIQGEIGELSLDIPPHLPNSQNIFGFEIDQPPRM
jgi:hypothetical protein